jgi:hypothetical protein
MGIETDFFREILSKFVKFEFRSALLLKINVFEAMAVYVCSFVCLFGGRSLLTQWQSFTYKRL